MWTESIPSKSRLWREQEFMWMTKTLLILEKVYSMTNMTPTMSQNNITEQNKVNGFP